MTMAHIHPFLRRRISTRDSTTLIRRGAMFRPSLLLLVSNHLPSSLLSAAAITPSLTRCHARQGSDPIASGLNPTSMDGENVRRHPLTGHSHRALEASQLISTMIGTLLTIAQTSTYAPLVTMPSSLILLSPSTSNKLVVSRDLLRDSAISLVHGCVSPGF